MLPRRRRGIAGGIIHTRNGTRVTTTIVIAVLTAVGLAGCSPQGNAAADWLSHSSIIDATDVQLTGCEALCDPVVTGTVSDTASDDQIRLLGQEATDYLAEKDNNVAIELDLGTARFAIAASRDETSALADLALVALNDDRVSSATLSTLSAGITGAKTDLMAIFGDYSAPENPPLSVSADEADAGTFTMGEDAERCDVSAPLVAEFGRLLVNPSVSSVSLGLCATLDVTVTDIAARDAMIAELQPLASDPTLSAMEFDVLMEDRSRFSVTADTPALTPLFDLLAATPGVEHYSMSDDVLRVTVPTVPDLRPVITALRTVPQPESLSAITVTTDGGLIYLNNDGTTDAQMGIVDAMSVVAADGGKVSFTASPQPEGKLTFTPSDYDSALGEQIVDAIIASGLWKTSDTEIAVYSPPVVFTVKADAGANGFRTTRINRDENPDTADIVADLGAYWLAQQKAHG